MTNLRDPAFPAQDTTVETKDVLMFNTTKARIEFSRLIASKERTRIVGEPTKSIFDGEQTFTFAPACEGLLAWPHGAISSRGENDVATLAGPFPILINYRSENRAMSPPSMRDISRLGVEQKAILDGHRCIECEEKPSELNVNVRRIWLDPECEFVIRRYLTRMNHKEVRYDIHYAHDDQRGWSIIGWERIKVDDHGNVDEMTTASILECKLNLAINAAEFKMTWPLGTVVTDMTYPDAPTYYIIAANGQKQPLKRPRPR